MAGLGGPEWKEMDLNMGSGLRSDKGVLGGFMFFVLISILIFCS